MRYGNEALYNPLLWHRKRRRDYLTSYKEEQQYVVAASEQSHETLAPKARFSTRRLPDSLECRR
eukprot:scaffold37688_cov94-Skeletonema_marinoi.AAC.2